MSSAAQKAIDKRLQVYRKRFTSETRGRIGNLVTGAVYVSGLTGMIYATSTSGLVSQIINTRVPNTLGAPIVYGCDPSDRPGTIQVLSSWDMFDRTQNNQANSLVNHGTDHTWPGRDTVYVRGEQLTKGLAIPSSLNVIIYPDELKLPTGYFRTMTTSTVAITPPATTGKARIDLIVVTSAGAYAVRTGTEIDGYDNLTAADIPEPMAGDNIRWGIKSFTGQTALRKDGTANDFIDLRFSGASSGGTFLPDHATSHISTGTDPIAPVVAAGASGLMTGEDKTKLDSLSSLEVKTIDGAPDVLSVKKIIVSNGTLADNGGGQVTITTGGGGGGGGHTIQAAGTPMTARDNLNFIGMTVEDDAGNAATKVSVTGAIEIGIDGSSATPSTGVLLDFTVPCDLTITSWRVVGNIAGNIQVDLWKDTFANHPPTIVDTVTAADKPKLVGAISASGAATGWIVNWNATEIIRVNIDSASMLTKANITLFYVRR